MKTQNLQDSKLNLEKENVYPAKPVGRSGVSPVHAGIQAPIALLILLLTFVVLGLGVFLGKTFFSSAKQNSGILTTPTVYVVPTTTEATSGAEMVNWKTYKNEKYEFQIKYPDSIYPKDEILNNNISFVSSGNQGDLGIKIVVNKNFDEYVNAELGSAKSVGELISYRDIEDISISGKIIEYRGIMGIAFIHAYIKSPKGIIIEIGNTNTGSSYNKFSQILSTFKFAEATK